MPTERVQRRIDKLLDQAEIAADGREWQSALASIYAVLEADPENEDALTLKRMAEVASAQSGDSVPANGGSAPGAIANTETTANSVPASFAAGRYVVSKFLGEGGKKKVYLAHDTVLDRDIAFWKGSYKRY